MKEKLKKHHAGFVMLSLILAIALIAILAVIYLKGNSSNQVPAQQKEQAEKSIEQTNKNLEDYQLKINQEQNIKTEN